jgi:hypothetical protein
MYYFWVLEVHDHVTFEASAAGSSGGAVSRPFEIGSRLPVEVFCYRVCQGSSNYLTHIFEIFLQGLV